MSTFGDNWVALGMILCFVAIPAVAVVVLATSSRLRDILRRR